MTDNRPEMNLGHLALSKASVGSNWLETQAEKRSKDIETVTVTLKKWFGNAPFPEQFYRMTAERIVQDLNQKS